MEKLSNGSRGADVRLLQYGLGIKTDGIFGPNTEDALKNWQKKLSIPQTGIMTRIFWDNIFAMELEKMKHLRFAEALEHVREEDIDHDGTTDNRGELIDVMIQNVWSWWEPEPGKAGPPWCAIFISYCLHAAYNFGFDSAAVKDWYEWLGENDHGSELKSKDDFARGNIYIGGYLNANGKGHIFFVDPIRSLQEDGDRLGTIEGNTNAGGGREGTGVFKRYRDLNNYWVFAVAPDS